MIIVNFDFRTHNVENLFGIRYIERDFQTYEISITKEFFNVNSHIDIDYTNINWIVETVIAYKVEFSKFTLENERSIVEFCIIEKINLGSIDKYKFVNILKMENRNDKITSILE